MRTCVLFLVCPLPCVLCSLPRLTVLLPALPDVYLSAQREVQVQPPVRLPLGDRGHIRLRDTPHMVSEDVHRLVRSPLATCKPMSHDSCPSGS